MRRRDFIMLLGGGAAAWPARARGQQPHQVRQIGVLMPYPKSDAESQSYIRAFRQELARLGWSEGGNVQFDERWSTSDMDLVRADAANLVALNPDVIVIVGDRVIPILTKLTRSIPIVVALTSDPIASGAVESLARPGRNVTGFSLIEFSIFGKMLETLKGLAPGISRVGMMYNPDNPVGAAYSYCVTNFGICFEPRSMGNAIASWRERRPISVALLQLSSERGVQAATADPLGW